MTCTLQGLERGGSCADDPAFVDGGVHSAVRTDHGTNDMTGSGSEDRTGQGQDELRMHARGSGHQERADPPDHVSFNGPGSRVTSS